VLGFRTRQPLPTDKRYMFYPPAFPVERLTYSPCQCAVFSISLQMAMSRAKRRGREGL